MKNSGDLKKQKRVAYWLLLGAFMIIVQIIIGGVTRLTGSGLSITEWQPVLGVIPPLNHEEWLVAFEKYQGIAQFKRVNPNFTLDDFKFIYFWEWFHRIWARSLGVVFAIPFAYFIVKKYFTKKMILPLIILFILGGLQGLVGWIMVKSGLNDTNIYVSHIRLTIHFMSALILLVYTFWFALKLLVKEESIVVHPRLKTGISIILGILIIQLIYGGFMAGLRAAPAAPTWPSMNGTFAPPTLMNQSWTDNMLNVQFIHRLLAYILVLIIAWNYFQLRKVVKENPGNKLLKNVIALPFIFVVIQLILGIYAVITTTRSSTFGKFEWFAELHQTNSLFLLLSLILLYYILRRKKVA